MSFSMKFRILGFYFWKIEKMAQKMSRKFSYDPAMIEQIFIDEVPPPPNIAFVEELDFEENLKEIFKQSWYKRIIEWAERYNLLIYAGFLLYILAGAGLFYSIEHLMEPIAVEILNESNCLSQNSFSTALFYANSLASTVGYGSVYACTTLGQIFSVFYATIGIPFVLVILQKLGITLFKQLAKLQSKIQRSLQVFQSKIIF